VQMWTSFPGRAMAGEFAPMSEGSKQKPWHVARAQSRRG